MTDLKWQFWIDRGGTFTDIVARKPNGELETYKLLSENPNQYKDAAIEGICHFFELKKNQQIPKRKREILYRIALQKNPCRTFQFFQFCSIFRNISGEGAEITVYK